MIKACITLKPLPRRVADAGAAVGRSGPIGGRELRNDALVAGELGVGTVADGPADAGIGAPQWGQDAASVEISLAHSRQEARAISLV